MNALVDTLATRFPGRGACTDVERRAAVWLHAELARGGHQPWMETLWVRPQWALMLMVHALLGVAASLAAVAAPLPALIAAGALTVSFALELIGFGGVLRPLLIRRATQVVLTEPPEAEHPEALTVLVVAATDTPRRGFLGPERLRLGWVLAALAVLTLACAARVAGLEETWLSVVQFLPTLALIGAVAAAIDVGLSSFSAGEPENAVLAVALALHEELARRPPENVGCALVLAGAGELFPLGARAHLRRERPDRRRTVVLELAAGAAEEPAWWAHHSELAEACLAAEESIPARRERPRRPTAARAAATMGLAAARVRCPQSLTPGLDFCLAVVDELDARVAARAPEPVAR